MYHIAKVLKVLAPDGKDIISADRDTQAALEMWDTNQTILYVEPAIVNDLKQGDFVLVDYRPMLKVNFPAPRGKIVKILRGKLGEETFEKMRDYHENKHNSRDKGNNFFSPPQMVR